MKLIPTKLRSFISWFLIMIILSACLPTTQTPADQATSTPSPTPVLGMPRKHVLRY